MGIPAGSTVTAVTAARAHAPLKEAAATPPLIAAREIRAAVIATPVTAAIAVPVIEYESLPLPVIHGICQVPMIAGIHMNMVQSGERKDFALNDSAYSAGICIGPALEPFLLACHERSLSMRRAE
jgi:hypothetical protein